MDRDARWLFSVATGIQKELPRNYVPPSEGTIPKTQQIIPHAMVIKTRGYIERVVFQINGSYENGWYDCCAVMMRRLLETLVIETFEHHNISHKIKKPNGDFLYLSDLLVALQNEPTWNIGRNSKKALSSLKDIGDQSAHNRRFVAHREDVDKLSTDFRVVIQELLFLAALK